MDFIRDRVWHTKRFTAPAKQVLLYLADQADDDFGGVMPKLQAISAWSRLSEQSVHLALRELRKATAIRVETLPSIRGTLVCRYTINILQLEPLARSEEVAP